MGPLAVVLTLVATPVAGQDVPERTGSPFLLQGVVRDAVNGAPVPFVLVSLVGPDRSTMTDRRGRYRVPVPAGSWDVRFRKIGYRMRSDSVRIFDRATVLDVVMEPVPIELAAISVVAEREDLATRIIRRAIARKRDVLARIHDYRYSGYVKFLVRDMVKNPDSTESVFLITESQTKAYWQQPDKYQETITARQQSSNLDAENNLVSVGEIVNFNRDRIDLRKYSVVSPTADDALDHYRYHVADTLLANGRLVYRLAIEPKSDADPLFVGWIDIADSTYDVLAVDVRANAAVRFDFLDNLRYRQRLSNVGGDFWMPTEIRFTGEVHVGVPLPGFPEHLSFEHTALLSDFRFDAGEAPRTLGEYLIVVDEGADDIDSVEWASRRPTPLTALEQAAYGRLDSLDRLPQPLGKRLLSGFGSAVFLSFNRDFFHYNRVEGGYVGAGATLRDLSPSLIVRLKSGYAFGSEDWQHRYGVQVRVSERQRVWLGASYHDEIISPPTFVSPARNSTYPALLLKVDPLDYYRSRGFAVSVGAKLLSFSRLEVQYNDAEHTTRDVVSDFSLFDKEDVPRGNPPIQEGRLRSLSASVTFDSRPRLKRKGRDFYLNTIIRTQATLGVEYASPGLIRNDFDFVRYYLRLHRRQRTLNMGITTIDVRGGISSGRLPPQRYFTVDFGNALFFQGQGFNTVEETNFSGNRALMVSVAHDFDQQLFRKSRIPVVRDLPLTASVHGGVFWTDFVSHTTNVGDELRATAPTGYSEIGFGVGNLTPIISPFNFSVWFTWQLSSYDTDRFVFRVGVPGM